MGKPASEIPNKLFYKIGEVCDITDTQPYVLRFWESEFPQLAPRKNRSGQRVYQKKDIETVFRIKKLLYEEEYTIAGARKKLDEESPGSRGAGNGATPAAAAPPAPQAPAASRMSEGDHPADALAARPARAAKVGQPAGAVAAAPDPERGERLEKALAELKELLREALRILRSG